MVKRNPIPKNEDSIKIFEAFLRSIGEVLGKSFRKILVTCWLIIFTTDRHELVSWVLMRLNAPPRSKTWHFAAEGLQISNFRVGSQWMHSRIDLGRVSARFEVTFRSQLRVRRDLESKCYKVGYKVWFFTQKKPQSQVADPYQGGQSEGLNPAIPLVTPIYKNVQRGALPVIQRIESSYPCGNPI